jgi:hypothetical protein
MTRTAGASLILISVLISTIFSVCADMEGASLGALINYFWPPFVGLITIGLFFFFSWMLKEKNQIIFLTVLFSVYNIYIGIALFLGKDYWPLVIF